MTVAPAGTPIQEQYDQAFAFGLATAPGMVATTQLVTPSAAIAGGWPALSVAETPEAWAEEFTNGLLSINYSAEARQALGAWLQAQEAPELLPGVPSSAAEKILYVSVLEPTLFGNNSSPIPSASQWAQASSAGTRQSVSDVLVQPDPSWVKMTAAGWQPTDARMAEFDVSGRLTTVTAGHQSLDNFSLQLIVGSARWHDGYGSVAVAGWKETQI